ncbi:antitoxin [soil metagenome]
MTRTQIQLPDELYQRAKSFAAEREISLAEVTRRGIELFLERFPPAAPERKTWQLPRIHGGGIKVPLEKLREISAEEESTRGHL